MAKIYWAGDSTIKTNNYQTYPQTGMGQVLPYFLKPEVEICSFAENGRSTKSFIDEGRLAQINRLIGRDDFLFMSFGHNDEKVDDPCRYTEPFGSYQENLTVMIETARAKGAYPVLLTPLYRRRFDENGNLEENGHLEYPAAMRQLAVQKDVPCIDLCRLSFERIAAAGDAKSKQWFMVFESGMYENYPEGASDNTHLRFEGAAAFAKLIAAELSTLGGQYRNLVR